MYVWMYGCMDGCMHVCMDACMHVCMYGWMHACMYVCIFIMFPQLCPKTVEFRTKFNGFQPPIIDSNWDQLEAGLQQHSGKQSIHSPHRDRNTPTNIDMISKPRYIMCIYIYIYNYRSHYIIHLIYIYDYICMGLSERASRYP